MTPDALWRFRRTREGYTMTKGNGATLLMSRAEAENAVNQLQLLLLQDLVRNGD